jgi:hypothetical protein
MALRVVEDYLLAEIGRWHGGEQVSMDDWPGSFPSAWDEHFQAQLDALVAVGLLEPHDAQRWRQEWDDHARHPLRAAVGAAHREQATRYLEGIEAAGAAADAIVAAVTTLESLGVVDMEQVARWIERAAAAGDEDADLPDVGEDDLRRVALGPVDERLDGFRVVCVELYPRGAVMRWTAREGDVSTASQEVGGLAWAGILVPDEPDIALSDDLGTVYTAGRSSAAVTACGRARGSTSFTPVVPEAASRLVVERNRREITIPLGT